MQSRISIAVSLTLAVACPSVALADDPVEIHGFASQTAFLSTKNKYLAPDSKKGSLEYNEFALNATKSITDKLRAGIQLFARDLGDFDNDTVTIDWAYGDYRWRDWLGFRAGKIKLPLGLYNETRDLDMLRTNILLPQSVYGEDSREVLVAMQGFGLYGHIPAWRLGSFNYQLLVGSVDIPTGGSTMRNTEMVAGGAFALNSATAARALAGQLIWETPLRGLRLGASNMRGSWSMTGATTAMAAPLPAGRAATIKFDNFNRVILSAELTWRDLTLATEYMRTDADITSTIDVSGLGMPSNTIVTPKTNRDDGFYVSASYRFSEWFELGTYYSASYMDRNHRDGSQLPPVMPAYNGYQKDIDLSLRFDVSEGWCLKAEAHSIRGAALVRYDVQNTEKDWFFFAAKASYTF